MLRIMDMKQFGERLAKLRLERGLSQSMFTERLGWKSRKRLQDIEQGRGVPHALRELPAIAKALGCTLDFLLREEP